MSNGFGAGDGKAKVFVQKEEVEKLIKEYKKIKKYMKSPLYEIKIWMGVKHLSTIS